MNGVCDEIIIQDEENSVSAGKPQFVFIIMRAYRNFSMLRWFNRMIAVISEIDCK